jgi:hypothetical protein
LVGVGLAWLIASGNSAQSQPREASLARGFDEEEDYPYARVSGSITRLSHKADDSGNWWSEFQTDAGKTFKARATETGARAGHFTDEAGKRFSGFIDDTGNRVKDFQDEAGNRLDEALGWASHNWSNAQRSVAGAMNSARAGVSDFGNRVARSTQNLTSNVGGTVLAQSDQLGRQVTDLFNQQPLVAGALAFAAGAAIGALLPSTPQEDALIGEQADKLREQASKAAGDLYQKGKEQVSQVYDDATRAGTQVYESAKDELSNAGFSTARH